MNLLSLYVSAIISKKLSYRKGTTLSVEMLSTAVQLYETLHLKRLTIYMNDLEVTQCHRKWHDSLGHIIGMVCTNNVSHCIILEILPLLQYTWLHMTLRIILFWHNSWNLRPHVLS